MQSTKKIKKGQREDFPIVPSFAYWVKIKGSDTLQNSEKLFVKS